MMNYYFNVDGSYAYALPCAEDTHAPDNAARIKPDGNEELWKAEGIWPSWNGITWGMMEDHRGKSGYVDGHPFTINELGSLPAGWDEVPPPLSGEDLRIERKMTTISRLAQIDSESMRPLRAKLSGIATADDDARILALENEASQLREELARIMSWQT